MNRKFQSIIYTISQGNPKVLLIFLISALFLTIVRILAPIELYWDAAWQLQTSYNFLKGLGLTYSQQLSPNLNDDPSLILITQFPPGFPLIVVPFLALGFPLVIALKILYSLTIIFGWLGWGIIGSHLLKTPLKIGSITLPAHLFVAAVLPLFYTPRSEGTDIFLWAIVPFVILLLFNAIKNNTVNIKLIIIASILVAIGVYFRYAAVFLFLVGLLIFLQQGLPNLKTVIKSSILFFLTSGLLIVPLYIYIKIATTGRSFEQINFNSQYARFNLWEAFLKILQSASVMANLSGLPLQQQQMYNLDLDVRSSVLGLICLIIFGLITFLTIIKNQQTFKLENFQNNFSLSIAIVPICVFLTLLLCNLTSGYDYVGTPRYYIPAIVPTILVAYELATVAFNKYLNVIKYAFFAFVIGFLAYNLIVRSIGTNPGQDPILFRLQKNFLDSHIFVYRDDYQYPSNKIMTQTNQTLGAVEKLMQENPEALVMVQHFPFYLYQAKSLKIKPIPSNPKFWEEAYIDQPTTIFWEQNKDCPHAICGFSISDSNEEVVTKFSDDVKVETVFESTEGSMENTKIIKTYFPKAGKIPKEN